MNTVMGIDPSFNGLGVAYRNASLGVRTLRLGSGKLKGMPRLANMRDNVSTLLSMYNPSLVVYEGYALGFRGSSNILFGLGELGGVLKLLILERGIDILLVPPTSLKLYATGKGNADKDAVKLALFNETGVQFNSSDESDAAGLMLMGEGFRNLRLLSRDRRHYRRRALEGCLLVSSDFALGCKK